MSQTPVALNPDLQAYVTRISERIVQASNSPYPDWQFVVFEGEQANAFALPGGYVGMLDNAANEAQLATMLGHEVGHLNARHGAERLVTEQAIMFALRLGAMLLAFGDVRVPPEFHVRLVVCG